MSETVILSFLSVIIVSLISFVGALALAVDEKILHKIVLYMIGFSAGALLGDAFIHLIPDAAEQGFTLSISLYILTGIMISFLVEKVIHWKHHHHDHTTNECRPGKSKEIKPFAYMNLIGDGVHNFIDGLIIGASYLTSIPIGIATTIAVVFHEIPQEIGDFSVLIHGGFTKKKALFYNFLSAVTAVIGVAMALVSFNYIPHILNFLIPFAAGGFVYIAGSDLIPELHHEVGKKQSIIQFLALIIGMLVMWALLFIE